MQLQRREVREPGDGKRGSPSSSRGCAQLGTVVGAWGAKLLQAAGCARVKTSSETVSCWPDPSKERREARALELVRWPEIWLCRKQVTNLPDRKLVLDCVP